MGELDDPLGAVGGLALSGIILLMFGSTLSSTSLGGSSYIDFGVWGVIFLFLALLLGVAIVVTGIATILRGV